MTLAFTDAELARWRARVCIPPRTARLPLYAGEHQVGSLEPSTVDRLRQGWELAPSGQGMACHELLIFSERENQYSLAVKPDFDQNLARLASVLHETGAAGAWRNERLSVRTEHGQVLGRVERGVIRVLGMRTQAVHLVGRTPDGRIWVQQRSWTKPNDPGLWDTLMGGTVGAGESLNQTLERETWEEAGLVLNALTDLMPGGHFTATRHVPDGGGAGYLVEDTAWYTATVPATLVPTNQDGEVDHFEAWTPAQVVEAMRADRFTPEACWVLAQVLA